MPLSLVKSAALAALMVTSTTVPVFAADTLESWADDVRQEFASKQRYPRRARQANIEGTVKVRVRVAASGSVSGFEIVERSGNEYLDAEALDLIARVDPLPAVPSVRGEQSFVIPLNFRLTDTTVSADSLTVEETSDEMVEWQQKARRQVTLKQTYPQYLINRGVEGSVKLRVDIAANGLVTEASLLQSSGNEELDEEALLMAGDLRLPELPEGKESFTLVLPLKYELAAERTNFARR